MTETARFDSAAQCAVFIDAARRYWLSVFPQVRRELRHWDARAAQIPDPTLRRLALEAQAERGNVEGAAAFAAFVPRRSRRAVVRALVAYQSAYNYLDLLAEQPRAEAIEGGRRLHEALLVALETGAPGAPAPDYYAHYPQREDNGYLQELVAVCRAALATLPSYAAVLPAARRSAARIVAFQTLNLSQAQGEQDALAQWALAETPPGAELRWWEAAAAGGSSLGVYALVAAAADPRLDPAEIERLEHAYFPWIGALHSLLDHLVDRAEDAESGHHSLVERYASPRECAARMQMLTARALAGARALPRGRRHAILLAGMASYYLSAPEASTPDALPAARSIKATLGQLATPTLLVFKARRFAAREDAQLGDLLRRASRHAPQRPLSALAGRRQV